MAFPDAFLDELVIRNEISDVVSAYVRLTPKGSNLFGLCPFHSEKTPSFSVSQDKQIYHCFGCGKGGGVINFIMEIEHLSFPDAVRFLADRVGMTVPEDGREEVGRAKDRMLALNKAAARFFHETLYSPAGAAVLEYAARRKISKAMITRFGLGAAPDSWDALIKAMHSKGFTNEELVSAGLAMHSNKTGGIYDTFRNRFMFPIIDVRGAVIGFSGRVLAGDDRKYVNTKDTLVFNKKRNLFALNLAKRSKLGYILLVEGNIDVVALHQAGFDCTVATLGTALTEEQARLLSRYTKEVVLSYDTDAAGQKATTRAIEILERVGLRIRVLHMQGAKDPDEYIKKFGADAFSNLLEASENHIEYRLLAIRDKNGLETSEQKVAFLLEAADLLASLPSPVEREIYGRRVAEMAEVSVDAVAAEVTRAAKRRRAAEKKRRERAEMRPAAAAQPKERTLQYKNIRSAMAEEGVLRLLMLDPQLFDQGVDLTPADFSSPFLGRAYGEILQRQQTGRQVSIGALAAVFSPEEIAQLTQILQKPENLANSKAALRDYIEIIRTENLRQADGEDLRAISEKYRQRKGYGG